MAGPEAAVAARPSPEECGHPAPVTGVMAHEFAHYEGAVGPEGPRRTRTFYGPVVGGLPIQAWHCEECGLLRLDYPDGRKEERHLHPGPQPGLITVIIPEDPQAELFGVQPRVSGLSAPAQYFAAFEVPPGPSPLATAWRRLPDLGAVTWMSVIGLVLVAAGLLLAGILAVYSVSTPSGEGPLVGAIAAIFVAVAVLQIVAAAFRHFFPMPELVASPAVTGRGKPELDGATLAAVILLVIAVAGLLCSAILAVYDVRTSDLEGPIFLVTLGCAVAAGAVKLADAARRHLLNR